MTRPRVSVLIDTYNHERFIEQAIVSVLGQDFLRSEMEVLVVDDGSTDRTPEIIRKFEPRVRLLRKPNGGQASAFNTGIPETRSEFISFLDGDDWWAPTKLTRALQTFEEEPELGFVGHGDILVYPDGRQLVHTLRDGCRFRANTLEGAHLFRLRKAFLGTSRMTARTNILKGVLPIPESLRIQADEYMFTLAATLCNVRILPEALFYYRIHDSNAFLMATSDHKRQREKQRVLAELAGSIDQQLRQLAIEDRARCAITECIQMEADQLRLMIDGGWPWETVKTERKTYEVMHTDAPFAHRLFKILTLLLAATIPPKVFYRIRQKISQNHLYLGVRNRCLPILDLPHIEKDWRSGS